MTRVLVVDIPGWSDRFEDEAAAVRHFDPVIVSVENTVPLVRMLRPGRIAMGARGPARCRARNALLVPIKVKPCP